VIRATRTCLETGEQSTRARLLTGIGVGRGGGSVEVTSSAGVGVPVVVVVVGVGRQRRQVVLLVARPSRLDRRAPGRTPSSGPPAAPSGPRPPSPRRTCRRSPSASSAATASCRGRAPLNRCRFRDGRLQIVCSWVETDVVERNWVNSELAQGTRAKC
jgi:hypothetical protein